MLTEHYPLGMGVRTHLRSGKSASLGSTFQSADYQRQINLARNKIQDELSELLTALDNCQEAIRLVWSANSSAANVGGGLLVAASVLPVSRAWVNKLIVDSILNSIKTGSGPVAGMAAVLPLLLAEFDLVLVGSLTNELKHFYNRVLQADVKTYIHELILSKSVQMDLEFFENPKTFSLLQNVRRNADSNALKISNSSMQLVQHLITLLTFSAALLNLGPWLPLIILATSIPSFLAKNKFSEREHATTKSRARELGLASYLESLLTGSQPFKEVKLFGLGDMLLDRYRSIHERINRDDFEFTREGAISNLGWSSLSSIAYYGSYSWAIYRILNGNISLGEMTMMLSIIRQSQFTVQYLLESLHRMVEGNLYMADLVSFLKLDPQIKSPQKMLTSNKSLSHGIEFRNVSFAYQNSDKFVLHNINLTIKAGEKIALVGMNGAGKTTLIKLLTRLYDPVEGQVLLDGVDLREYDLDTLHQLMSVIFQDFARYQLSAGENIGMGQVDAMEDIERIKKAASSGGASALIESLPKGYATPLGKTWDKGQDLSGGQWQKMALSRAFMREADIIVLDEPTSSMDAQSEHDIFEMFKEVISDRTAILISHRFSTVRLADRIIVLSNGEIVEMGSHEELMQSKGIYENLFNLQADVYR